MRENKDKDAVSFLASEVRNTWCGSFIRSRNCMKAMAAQFSCSFASHSNSTCSLSARFPGKNEFFPLSSCTKDIKSHLRQLKVAQTSVVSEKDLFLARVGWFLKSGGKWYDSVSKASSCAGSVVETNYQMLPSSDENRNEEQACRCVKSASMFLV